MTKLKIIVMIIVLLTLAAQSVKLSLAAEFLDIESFPKVMMISNNQKLSKSLEEYGPFETALAKRHADMLIIKQRHTGEISFYKILDESFVNPLYAAQKAQLQEFFLEKKLDDYDIIQFNMGIAAKKAQSRFSDVFIYDWNSNSDLHGFIFSESGKRAVREIFDSLNWKDGEFAVSVGRYWNPYFRVTQYSPHEESFVVYEIPDYTQDNASFTRSQVDPTIWYGSGFSTRQDMKLFIRRSPISVRAVPYHKFYLISLELVNVLLEAGCDLNEIGGEWSSGFLHLAMWGPQTNPKAVRLLISAGANVNLKSLYTKHTPLAVALQNNVPVEVLKILVEHRANLFYKYGNNAKTTVRDIYRKDRHAPIPVNWDVVNYVEETMRKQLEPFPLKIWIRVRSLRFSINKKVGI